MMKQLLKYGLLCSLIFFSYSAWSQFENIQIQSREPTVSQEERELLKQVVDLSKENQENAIEVLNAGITSSSSPALDFVLGNFYLQKGELSLAESSYKNALKKMPLFVRCRANLGRVLIMQDKIDEAIKEFHSVLMEGQVTPETLTLIGYTFLLKGQSIPAETAYRHALLLKPEDTNAYLGLAKCLLEQERFREAVKILEDLLENNPQKQELWFLLANTNLALNKPDRAIVVLESSRRLKIVSSAALATLGELYLNQGQAEDALTAYREAFAGEDPSIDRLLRAVEGFIMMNKAQEAGELLERARSIEKQDPDFLKSGQRYKLCRLEAHQARLRGDHKQAFITYKKLLEEEPLDGDVLISLGDLYRETGELEEALISYERAARIAGKESQALIRQAQIEVERERYKRAADLLETAQALKPQAHVFRYLEQVRRLVR